MVQDANVKRMHVEKILEDANHQVNGLIELSDSTSNLWPESKRVLGVIE